MPTSKDTRRARHQQAENPTLDRGNPSTSEGRVGTQQFRKIPGKGLVHLVRDETGWKEMGTSQANTNQGDKVASSVSIASGVSATSTSSGGGFTVSVLSHNDLANLTADDHSQYVHNTIARTISANHSFTGQPSFSNIDINGGDIASGTTINKSPVVNFNSGDVHGSLTLTNLGNGTGSLTIQPDSVALGTDTTGNYMSNVTGNSQVSVSHSQGEGSTAALSIANDSIGDTQLEYNTGQHLTTSSSPTFNDLTTNGDILVKGDDISSYPFSSGFTGSGWKIDNSGHLEVNDATIRGTLSVFELLIQQIRATNGAIFVSSSAKVESSSGLSASDDDGTITFEDPSNNNICPFAANDLIMMQRINPGALVASNAAGGATNVIKKLIYKVASVNGKTITVENGGFNNTSSPSAGDDFVRIGNTSNSARQGIIYLTSDDSNSPFIDIKADIDSYSDWTSSLPKVRLGKLDGITDTNAGLNGSQSNLFGLYSDSVHLKGHFYATSGTITNSVTIGGTAASTIETKANESQNATQVNNANKTGGSVGGWNIDGSAIYSGSKTTSGFSSNGHITFLSTGEIHTPTFYVESDGTSAFKGTVNIGGTDLTTANTLNENTVWGDVAGTTNAPANNATANRSDAATDSAVNSAAKTGGSVGGWSISGSAITGSNIVMSSSGNIAVSNGYSLNNNGSASFANGNITFEQNGDITSNTYLIERSRLFGDGTDSYNGSSYVSTVVYTNTRDSAYGESSYAINMPPATSTETSNGYGQRIMFRDGSNWKMVNDGYFKDFTVKSGVTLYTQGYRLFCNGTLTIESGAVIENSGSNAVNSRSGAAGGLGANLHAGASGKDGGLGGNGTQGSANAGGFGGGGGGSGGIILISARYISNSGTIRAKGGNGSNGEST